MPGIINQMGLVELGLVEQIHQEIGSHPQEIVSARVAVKAMIINGLGLVSASVYLERKILCRQSHLTSSS